MVTSGKYKKIVLGTSTRYFSQSFEILSEVNLRVLKRSSFSQLTKG